MTTPPSLHGTHTDQIRKLRSLANSIYVQVQTLEELTPHPSWPAERITTVLAEAADAISGPDDAISFLDTLLTEPNVP